MPRIFPPSLYNILTSTFHFTAWRERGNFKLRIFSVFSLYMERQKLGFQFLHLFQQVSLSLQSHSRLIRRPAYSLVKKGASLLAVNDQLKGAAAPWQILENYQVKS